MVAMGMMSMWAAIGVGSQPAGDAQFAGRQAGQLFWPCGGCASLFAHEMKRKVDMDGRSDGRTDGRTEKFRC